MYSQKNILCEWYSYLEIVTLVLIILVICKMSLKGRVIVESKKNYITADGLKKLEEELAQLKRYLSNDVAQKIKEAREQGDLSEHAEYDAAMDEQRDTAAQIEKLENLIKNAEIITGGELGSGKVNIGCTVKVYDVDFDEEMEFKLVGSTEANSLENKISNESPVGRALIGATVGSSVQVETEAGIIEYKILEIK